jgi:hypothetical protein
MTRKRMVRVSLVQPVHDFVVRLTFTDGTVRDDDLAPFLWGPVFEPLGEDPPSSSAKCESIMN